VQPPPFSTISPLLAAYTGLAFVQSELQQLLLQQSDLDLTMVDFPPSAYNEADITMKTITPKNIRFIKIS
jgi:hypothetical protein